MVREREAERKELMMEKSSVEVALTISRNTVPKPDIPAA